MIEARPAGISDTPYAENTIQPRIAKVPQSKTGLTSRVRNRHRFPDKAEISNKIQPPRTRHRARNHHTGISDKMIFIPGQFKPQNSDNDANNKIGDIDVGGKDIF